MALSKFARARRRLAAGLTAQQPAWRNPDPKPRYDAIIIGGGGHGLATAYYLAKIHRMRHTVAEKLLAVQKEYMETIQIAQSANGL